MDIVKAFNSNNLHTDIIIKGDYTNPLFRASDIAEILEITSIRKNLQEFDDSEKTIIKIHTNGGEQSVTFLTEKGLYKVLFRSRKPIAERFQNWVCNIIKEIRITGEYKLKEELAHKNKELEETKANLIKTTQENEELQNNLEKKSSKHNIIYIYNTDVTKERPELKIGYTSSYNFKTRFRPMKQVTAHGKTEFHIEIKDHPIKEIETAIHKLLSRYKLINELFILSVDEAKFLILNYISFLDITIISNNEERILKLKQLYEKQVVIRDNLPNPDISTNTISVQTDFQENIPESIPIIMENTILQSSFSKYIDEMCIIHADSEVSTVDILGQYRIWSKTATKENYHALKSILDEKFKQIRLSKQDKNSVINGYKGIKLKEIHYKRQLQPTEAENFVFNSCIFSPSSKVLHNTIFEEYKKWKLSLNKEILEIDEKNLRNYLKSCGYTLFTTIWTDEGNGQGYYGVTLKSRIEKVSKTSSTGKTVEKRCIKTDNILGTWSTIAKAAESENMCSSKLSRSIRAKTVFDDDYYFSCKG